MSKWISVEARLPKNQDTIDVWCEFRVTDCKFTENKFYIDILDNDEDFSHSELLEGVTHWMPLPEPPELNK